MAHTEEASYHIQPFDAGRHTNAGIGGLHLSIRQWQFANHGTQFPDVHSSQADLGAIEKHYVARGGNFFIAHNVATDQIVGFVGIRNDGEAIGTVKRLAVLPEHHRKGIATELISTAIDWAKTHGFTNLELSTGETENAKPIYERLGFKVVGRKANNDYLMELEL